MQTPDAKAAENDAMRHRLIERCRNEPFAMPRLKFAAVFGLLALLLIASFAFVLLTLVSRSEWCAVVLHSTGFVWCFLLFVLLMLRHEKRCALLIENAERDALTHLYNRRKVREVLGLVHEAALAGGAKYTVAMIDVDDFKRVNDTSGHDVGDAILRKVADGLLQVSSIISGGRPPALGTWACRWGGDEFMLISQCPFDEVCSAIEQFRSSLRQSCAPITVTAGICQWQSGMAIADMVHLADKRLYDGKSRGKNVCVASG